MLMMGKGYCVRFNALQHEYLTDRMRDVNESVKIV